MKKKEAKGIGRIVIFILLAILIIVGIAFAIYAVTYNEYKKAGMASIFEKVDNTVANLTEYIIYGTHLNLKGEITDNISDVTEVNLVFIDLDGKEKRTKLNYIDNGAIIEFYTSDLINDGIDLEKIDINKHYILIEAKYGKRESKYYSIQNNTEYDKVLYYTITKNNSNNKINIGFGTYVADEKNVDYMEIDVKSAKLPKDVYDIVIDPGHGGSDNGAEYAGYSEADLTIEYGKKVKTELEKLGLKVKLTRDGTENEETFGAQTVYDKDGRVNIVGLSKAKYVFSIHLNSITEANSQERCRNICAIKNRFKACKIVCR